MEANQRSTSTHSEASIESPTYTSTTAFRMLNSSSSPIIPVSPQLVPESSLLSQYFSLPNADEVKTETLPNIGNTIKNFVTRQTYEIRDGAEMAVPKLSVIQDLKKQFRDFYIKEATHVFDFLDQPLNTTLKQSQIILKRFGRADYNANRVKIKDLVLDLSCNTILDQINLELSVSEELTPIEKWCAITKQLIKVWKISTTELAQAERNLSAVITTFQDVHKKVQPLLNMPTNDAYAGLIESMEGYLKSFFEEHRIEEIYLDFIKSLKKVSLLTDTMNYVRFFLNSPTEPLCSICLTEPVTHASIPCGHTMCIVCSARQSVTCYMCRSQVKDKVRVYFT